MADLVEQFRNASEASKHKTGGISLVCLDDEHLPQHEYGKIGARTVVPRSRNEGGILGLPLGNDCKFGAGVQRRHIVEGANGEFVVEKEEMNFRPDKAAEELDLFSAETLADAGIDMDDGIPQDDPLALLQQKTAARLQGTREAPEDQPSEMMQMMGMMMKLMQTQQAPKPAPAPAPPAPKPAPKGPVGTTVEFSGAFGTIMVQYAEVKITKEFLVLVTKPDQPTMYTPPITAGVPLQLTVGDKVFPVLNLDLRFSHKGDILLLMPLALNQEETNA